MSKAQTPEEKLAAKIVTEAKNAEAAGHEARNATETVNVTITPVLNEKAEDGGYYTLQPQVVPLDRPKGLPTTEGDRLSVAQAWSLVANNGGLTFRSPDGKVHIYPLTTIHHLEIEVSPISAVTLD